MSTRRPARVYAVGEEPDPRYSLANERTFLAWVRTAVAFLAGGIALETLDLSLPDTLRTVVAVGLVLLGGLTALAAWLRWARVERAMRTGQPLPAFTSGPAIVALLALVAVVMAVAMVVD